MLLSKALKMQQDLEDKKHEVIIGNLESKIKEQSAVIEKKDFELQTTEDLLAEAEAKIIEFLIRNFSHNQKTLIKKSRSLTQNLSLKSKKVQI
jgi:hypothetical protein